MEAGGQAAGRLCESEHELARANRRGEKTDGEWMTVGEVSVVSESPISIKYPTRALTEWDFSY